MKLLLLLPFLFFPVGLPSACAQSNATNGPTRIHLTPDEVRDFSRLLTRFSRQARMAVVAESSPLPRDVTEETIRQLTEVDRTPKEAISLIAQAYDYEVAGAESNTSKFPQQRYRGTVVLKKRYTDPKDIPDLTPEECIYTINGIKELLRQHGPQPPVQTQTELILGIYRLLTPEQQSALIQKGLPISSLSENQKAAVWRMAVYTYLAFILFDMDALDWYANNYLKWSIQRQNNGDISQIGFAGVDQYKRPFFQASNIFSEQDQGLTKSGEMNSAIHSSASQSLPTLQDIVASLNHRPKTATNKVASGRTYTVDSHLAKKTVTVIGTEFTSPDEIMRALADVYGLHVTGVEKRTLTFRPIPKVNDIKDLSSTIYQLLPAPLRFKEEVQRKIVEGIDEELSQKTDDTNVTELKSQERRQKLRKLLYKKHDLENVSLRYEGLLGEIRQRIYNSIDQLQQNVNSYTLDKGIPVAKLDSAAQSGIAISLLLGVIRHVNSSNSLGLEHAPFVTHFEDTVLQGKITTNSNKNFLDILFCIPDSATGELYVKGGIKQIELDSP